MRTDRSRDDIALTDLLAQSLENLVALAGDGEERPRPTAAQILNAPETDVCVSPALFRLLQLVILPEVLGTSTGEVLYLAAKRFSGTLELGSLQDLKSWFTYMNLGELEIEVDDEQILVKLSHCLTCHRIHPVGGAVCDLQRGLVDGVLERIVGTAVITRETLCWGLGDTVCQFEAFKADNGAYAYAGSRFEEGVQRRLLAGLADQSEIAVENLHMVSESHAAQTRDALTGMFNFRHLREHAALELARSRRFKRQVAFVMLDIDGFADVNDAAGTEGGDVLLRRWSEELRRLLRTCDLTCRYGADEFLLVLPETADSQADQALDRVLESLKAVEIEAEGHTFTVTATAGVATFPDDGNLVEELVAKATTTMYVAKTKGPGSVAFYSPPAG
jgi:diguanylate cyclase (GGDEF)-like protein